MQPENPQQPQQPQPVQQVPQVAAAAPPPPKKKGWFRRNLAWFIPVLVLIVLGSCGGCIFGIFSMAMGMIKGSDVYQDALAQAKANVTVQAELGTPITDGWMPTGNISTSNSSGKADMSIPIKGPKGEGTIELVAIRTAGKWTYSTLQVTITGSGKTIDLLAGDG